MDLIQKSKGIMVGLACGDALGALVEFMPKDFLNMVIEIKDMAPPLPLETLINQANSETTLNRIQRYIDFMCLPGLYTDDTQQAILIGQSLVVNQGVNQEYIAKLFVKGFKSKEYGEGGVFRHAGPGFKESINNIMRFKPLNMCGAISAGNGAAMRIAPVGIYYRDDVDKLLKATIDISLITHRDIRGIAAAGIIAFTIAYLINKSWESLNISHLLSELKIFTKELEETIAGNYPTVNYTLDTKHQVSDSITVLEEIQSLDLQAAIPILDEWARKTSGSDSCYHNSAFALGSVLYSLYLFTTLGLNWEKAVLTAVNGGGDADTIAAMLGAMCGAIHGYESIPANWVQKLMNRESIEILSRALITLELPSTDFINIEKQLCKKELEYRNYYRQLLHKSLGFS
ncbi:MAG: hypothetical protein GX790_08475 [Syntrophomonadaceae bacterium]|nr:hypothetical protein [Syntrophomonadaceae bacterium]